MLKQSLILLAILPSVLFAQGNQQCVLQEKSVTKNRVQIEERSSARRSIIETDKGHKCVVDFRARIGSDWHSAHGEHYWVGEVPVQEACGMAMADADKNVIEQVSKREVGTERILICNDDDRHKTLRNMAVGTVASISQYRPHPNYPSSFYYNGTNCRWFLDTIWTGQTVVTKQGVVCQLQDDNWVVVDKF